MLAGELAALARAPATGQRPRPHRGQPARRRWLPAFLPPRVAAIDAIRRLFSNAMPAAATARALGLSFVSASPWLKSRIIEFAMR